MRLDPTAPILNGSSNDEEITWPTSSKSQLLTCTFSGTPKPRVTWTRNDKVNIVKQEVI